MLTSRERALRAIHLEEPDQVPVFDYYIDAPVASKLLGRPALVQLKNLAYEMLAKGKRDELVNRLKRDRVEIYKKLKLDIVVVNLVPGKTYSPPRRVGKYEWLTGDDNIWFKYRFDPRTGAWIRSDSSIKQRGIDGLEDYVRALESEKPSVDPTTLEMVEYAAKEVDEEMLVLGIGDGSFPVLSDNMVVFYKALYTRPDLVRRFLHETTKRAIENINAMIDVGAEAISDGWDIAGKRGPFISPKHFREFILPTIRAHSRTCHRRGVPFIKHTDGNIKPIEEDFLINSEIDGYLGIEPQAGMNIGELKRKYGDKICLLGNVDCAHTLVYGTKEEVARETVEVIKAAAHGGGLVIASSNSIHASVKPENFLTMIHTARKYGKYPRVG